MLTTVQIILALLVIAGIAYIVYRSEELDEREEYLDKYSVHLDERANKLARWEKELNQYELDKK